MEKNFIDEFIPSNDTRAYLHSIHHEFTDLEKATIVANHIKYLTNLYNKNRHMSEVENKPEYTGGTDDLLEQRYLGEYIPVQDASSGIWCVQTGHGFEIGDIDYIAAEFSGMGLTYHFMRNGQMDHVHGFDSVFEEVLQDPENVDIVTDYDEYSEQEINMVSGIKRSAMFVQSHRRPMTSAELRENRIEIKNKV